VVVKFVFFSCRIYSSLGVASPWWCYWAFSSHLGTEVQLWQNDLSQVLCSPSS
jgi:hypothetical protein